MSSLQKFIPLIAQVHQASRADLRRDLQAGLTTAVMLIPQGMAYAMLAGLPPITGLYASVVPLALYALIGTSGQLAVGPVAIVSMMVAAGVGTIAEAGSAGYLGLAALLAGMVGVIQVMMGIARLGFLVNLLSHPVISGFTSAAALLIGFSQLKAILGTELPGDGSILGTLGSAITHLHQAHLPTVALSLLAIAALMGLKRWRPRFPGALVVVLLGTVLAWALDLASMGVAVVGEVPAGMPWPQLPSIEFDAAWRLLPTAFAISLVGFMESFAVAQGFARRNGYTLNADRELIGLGAANLGAALFRGFPVTGGFSRSAVNAQAGARTNLAGLITAGAVGLSLVFLTPLFRFLPQAVLAAIILTAVLGLVDLAEPRRLWRTDKRALAPLLITFGATLLLGIELGIGVGMGAQALSRWAGRIPALKRLEEGGSSAEAGATLPTSRR